MPGDRLFENRCACGGLRFRGGGRGRGPQLGGLALRGGVLPPPSRLDSNAELFHGLTPTAKCGRRIRGLLEPPGWRFGGIIHQVIVAPAWCPVFRDTAAGSAGASGRGAAAAYAAYWNPRAGASGIAYLRIVAPAAGCGFGEGGVAAGRSWVGWRFGERCCRRLRGSTLALNFSMGLRPRLSADAASAAYWNPRAGASGGSSTK